MKLWLARHARPLLDTGICYGRLDVPADPQATREAAQALAAALPAGVPAWFSPLRRCEQLAQALQALRPDVACKADARLVEMDFGAWEGRPWSGIARAEIDAWTARFAHHAPGGGETVAALLARVNAACDDAHDRAAGGEMLWITHAGVARAVALRAAGRREVRQAGDWPVAAPAFGTWEMLA
ncbi:histidine phosphatase family protein [Ramlibacter sp. H39-3-26]|uniref:histidine phosphatase family protein n=1 Tax=Curvibacter soli TaxID=3031331 RepID=UPI0023D9A81A|nr:histidine phosphatase family protein [Ramlibacter sp. H39-3-26]MDF1483728.1 histidine phosphatase family protein [Ramlibacter sp. H39-3-26]